MSAVIWTPRASADLRRHLITIRVHDVYAADRIARRLLERLDRLADFPHSGSPVRSDLRNTVVAGTPLVVVDRPRPNGINIVRVFHERQDWR